MFLLLQEDTVYHSWKALLVTLVSQTIFVVEDGDEKNGKTQTQMRC